MADNTSGPEQYRVHNLTFQKYLAAAKIQARVREMGAAIARDFAERHPVFIVVLKGAYIFAADLLRACPIPQEVGFVRLSSYEGTQSSGRVRSLIELNQDISGRPVVIIEDIVDTGRTLSIFRQQLLQQRPEEVRIATLLHKPDAQVHGLQPDYVGFRIPDKFVIGYGLDYREGGRHLPGIYQLHQTESDGAR